MFSAVLLLGFFGCLGSQQYLATFRTDANAAMVSAVMLLIVGGPLTAASLVLALMVVKYAFDKTEPLVVALPLLAGGLFCLFAGYLNLAWRRNLRRLFPEGVPHVTRFSLRELLIGITVLAGIAGLARYLAIDMPPPWAEHVSPAQAKLDLPPGSRDVSYARGHRGRVAYEFTIDEAGFVAWVQSGIGSLEAQQANEPLGEIDGSTEIVRYCEYVTKYRGPSMAMVNDGLEYTWHDGDRGVHAVFDRRAQRAYYHSHSH